MYESPPNAKISTLGGLSHSMGPVFTIIRLSIRGTVQGVPALPGTFSLIYFSYVVDSLALRQEFAS